LGDTGGTGVLLEERAMQLRDVRWGGGNGLEFLLPWGVTPVKRFIELLEEYLEEEAAEDERLDWMILEIRDRVNELEAAITRMVEEQMGR
jgi:hypothetical protein